MLGDEVDVRGTGWGAGVDIGRVAGGAGVSTKGFGFRVGVDTRGVGGGMSDVGVGFLTSNTCQLGSSPSLRNCFTYSKVSINFSKGISSPI